MTRPLLTEDLRTQIQAALAACHDPREAELIRDLALLLCGARPAAYVWEAGPSIRPLVAAAEAAGFPVARWDDPTYGRYAALAHTQTTLNEVADLAERETAGPFSARDHGELGELLGYPAPSVLAYVRTDAARKAPMLAETDWTPDERRFLLCLHGADAASAAAGRAWTNSLVSAFRAAYGEDALARLPVEAPHRARNI